MEELIREFDRSQFRTTEETLDSFGKREDKNSSPTFKNITPALFFDRCPEIIHGFETLVTLIPSSNRTNLTIGLLTVNQMGTTEGFRKHMGSLFQILVNGKAASGLKKLPLLVVDMKGGMLQEAVNACADAILDIHGDNLLRTNSGKSLTELIDIIKEAIVSPALMSYQELLHLNIQEVEEILRNRQDGSSRTDFKSIQRFDANHFHSLLDYLQSETCSLYEFKQIHSFFMVCND